MAFTLPNFNLLCDWYTFNLVGGPPYLTLVQANVPCQQYNNSRVAELLENAFQLRLPKFATVGNVILANDTTTNFPTAFIITSTPFAPQFPDQVFICHEDKVMHAGFPNEYRIAYCRPYSIAALPALTPQEIC